MSPRLLIRLPNWLGDVVACLPLVEQAERALGSALTLVAPKPWHELLAQAAPRARVIGNRSGPLDFAWRGHAQALLLDGSMRSAFQAMGAGIGVRVGLGGGGRWALLTGSVAPARERGRAPLSQIRRLGGSRRSPRPFGSTAAELLALLPGHPAGLVQDPRPRVTASDEALARARTVLAERGVDPLAPWVLLNLGGRVGSTKGLPTELSVGLATQLGARGIPCLGVAGPGEEERLDQYAQDLAQGEGGHKPLVLRDPPADLPLLAALGSLAPAVVTPDGGGRHLLRAAGAPCLTLLGPTDPRHSALPGPPEACLVGLVPCGPCHLEHCPLPGKEALACWRGISQQEALDAVLGLLALDRPEG